MIGFLQTAAPGLLLTGDRPDAAMTSAPRARCVHYAPGQGVSRSRPGDVVLLRHTDLLGLLIRAFARIRFRAPEDRPYTYWSHVALVVSTAGHVVEVNTRGVMVSHIRNYRDRDYHYVALDLPAAGRSAAARYALSCVKQKYSVRNFLLLAATIALGDRVRMPDSGHGCVSLVARALQQAGIGFDRKPTDMVPADLAKQLDVIP
jgi:hypothetical protein